MHDDHQGRVIMQGMVQRSGQAGLSINTWSKHMLLEWMASGQT